MQAKQITPKQAYKLLKEFNAGMNDPMTQHYHAQEFVSLSFNTGLRRKGFCIEEVAELAEQHCKKARAKRIRFKDPAMLRFKEKSGHVRAQEKGHFFDIPF
jgi:hypothetical protein